MELPPFGADPEVPHCPIPLIRHVAWALGVCGSYVNARPFRNSGCQGQLSLATGSGEGQGAFLTSGCPGDPD